MKLIDKDSLVAEIDKHLSYYKDLKDRGILSKEGEAAYRVVRILKSNITSLEVQEMDLEKEIKNEIDEYWFDNDYGAIQRRGGTITMEVSDVKEIAKHFFELALSLKNS